MANGDTYMCQDLFSKFSIIFFTASKIPVYLFQRTQRLQRHSDRRHRRRPVRRWDSTKRRDVTNRKDWGDDAGKAFSTMRLLTHNMLQCPRTQRYPLKLVAETCDDVEVAFSEAFIKRMIPRLDWQVFLDAAKQLPDADMLAALPESPPGDDAGEAALRAVHRALMEWHVVEGALECDGARYRVKNGIPNLVITEVRREGMDVDEGDAAEGSSSGH